MTGFKERFQEKKKYPRLPKPRKEDQDLNPWGGSLTPALQRFINERRAKEKSLRESSNQNAQSRRSLSEA